MPRRIQLILRVAFVAAGFLFFVGSAGSAAPPAKPPAPKPVKPPKPTKKPPKPQVKPHPTYHRTFRVQARNAHWRLMATRTNHAAAVHVAHFLHRLGISTHIRHHSGTAYFVLGRNLHWHTRLVTHNPQAAHRVAHILHAMGFQTRIL
jgi:hypothetical protein